MPLFPGSCVRKYCQMFRTRGLRTIRCSECRHYSQSSGSHFPDCGRGTSGFGSSWLGRRWFNPQLAHWYRCFVWFDCWKAQGGYSGPSIYLDYYCWASTGVSSDENWDWNRSDSTVKGVWKLSSLPSTWNDVKRSRLMIILGYSCVLKLVVCAYKDIVLLVQYLCST